MSTKVDLFTNVEDLDVSPTIANAMLCAVVTFWLNKMGFVDWSFCL